MNALSYNSVQQALAVGDATFMPRQEAENIVAQTIEEYGTLCSKEEFGYLQGHAKRFADTLSRIPPARKKDELCLDVGGFALTPYWLTRHFGYRVHVLNWNPAEQPGLTEEKSLSLGGETATFTMSNVDLNGPWPAGKKYPFVLFCETLEHLNDPMKAMSELNAVCRMNGRALLSTPNAASFSVLRELLKGLPTWTFRYFEPDAGSTRHVFEQSFYSMGELALAAGFNIAGFVTSNTYRPDINKENPLLAETLGLDPGLYGETQFLLLEKTHEEPVTTRPSCLYDAETFYRENNADFSNAYWSKIVRIKDIKQSHTDTMETLREEVTQRTATHAVELARLAAEHVEHAGSYATALASLADAYKTEQASYTALRKKYDILAKQQAGPYNTRTGRISRALTPNEDLWLNLLRAPAWGLRYLHRGAASMYLKNMTLPKMKPLLKEPGENGRIHRQLNTVEDLWLNLYRISAWGIRYSKKRLSGSKRFSADKTRSRASAGCPSSPKPDTRRD